jgi:isocitrate dehydrogenase
MLVHLGLPDIASSIQNAWLKTLEDGIHTYDIYKPELSKQKVGTKAFGQAVIERLGSKPSHFKAATFGIAKPHAKHEKSHKKAPQKILKGVDIFIDWQKDVSTLHQALSELPQGPLILKQISNRGSRVWPDKAPETICIDSWRCRYTSQGSVTHADIAKLLQDMASAHIDFTHTEHLYTFDGKAGYQLTQEEQ